VEYHVKPIGKTCAVSGAELVPGRGCYSALVEQDGQLVRLDYSEEGWAGPPPGAIGYWKCIVPQPEAPKARPLDPDALLRYLEQLSEDANPAQEKFRYVLALLLLQKRRLRIEGARQDGEIEYLELIGTHGEGPFVVRDHHLADEEIEQLQHDLNAHLTAEWN
jgi:hypothetical protein